MRIMTIGLTVAALIALGACTTPSNPGRAPSDVGSMQLPSTGTAGVATTAPRGADVGSMTAPSGSGGVVTHTSPTRSGPTDTGNMALPSNAQGYVPPRRQ